MKLPLWRLVACCIVILVGVAVALPGAMPRDLSRVLSRWLPQAPVALGLDLRGGASLTLRADEDALADAMVSDMRDRLIPALTRDGLRAIVTVEGHALLVRPVDTRTSYEALRATTKEARPVFRRSALGRAEPVFSVTEDGTGGLSVTLRNAALVSALSDAMTRSTEILRERLDRPGLSEPTIRLPGLDRIQVQMPGLRDPAELRALLAGPAEPTFHRVAPDPGLGTPLPEATVRMRMAGDATSLRVGGPMALPVPLAVIEERRLHAALGEDEIAGALRGGIAGLGLVTAGMILLHGGWGLVTAGALLLNAVLTLAALTMLGAALTLPGIAGMILGAVLALDAGLPSGAKPRESTAGGTAGIGRARRGLGGTQPILLSATGLLVWLGPDPVREFALTLGLGLGLGILVSFLIAAHLGRATPESAPWWRGPRDAGFGVLPGTVLDRRVPPGLRRGGPGLLLALAVAFVALILGPGLSHGIDLRDATLSAETPEVRFDRIAPRVSAEIALAGLLALGAAVLAMLAGIRLRSGWSFAFGAFVALTLDLSATLGFLAVTGLGFGLTALLAVVIWSVNERLVLYDRIHANRIRYPAMPLDTVLDLSIDQSRARSIRISVAALAGLLPMALWGGTAVQGFALPTAFGIAVAAGSSVFVAAPILLCLGDRRTRPALSAHKNTLPHGGVTP